MLVIREEKKGVMVIDGHVVMYMCVAYNLFLFELSIILLFMVCCGSLSNVCMSV